MASVWPDQLGPLRVELSVAFVLLLMWGNLRGIREAGRIFAVPTYVYVVAVGVVTMFLVLRAFVSGTTRSPGSRPSPTGVSAFRAPEAVNAKKTLMVMAAIMGALFLGITYLAVRLEALPFEGGYPTVISQIALQYARQLNPLTITALHVAVDPDHARELGRLWARVHRFGSPET
jgi:amino acid transporter